MVPKKIVVEKADRMYQLPPELASFLPERRRRSLIKKTEILDLAMFRWQIAAAGEGSIAAEDLRPAGSADIARLKEALAGWYSNQMRAKLDPVREIFIGPGVTGLTALLTQAFVDHGDIVFVPEIGLPLYRRATVAAGGEPVSYGVSGKNQWMPDFERVGTRLGRVARILFLNSPHNPTGAELGEKELADLTWLAGRENIIVINDAAYLSISGRKPVSLMSVAGGRKIGAEVGSFSYLFGLPYPAAGFAVGNRDIISGLEHAARLASFHIPVWLVERLIGAIQHYPNAAIKAKRADIAASRAEAVKLADLLDLEVAGYDTVPFLWARIERRRQSPAAAAQLFRRGRIMVLPGPAFGESGDGFLRFALTTPAEDFAKAIDRVKKKPRLFKLSKEK